MYLQFGKHKGKHIGNVPQDYLRWLLTVDDLEAQLRKAIKTHLKLSNKKPRETHHKRPYVSKDFARETIEECRQGILDRRSWYLLAPKCPFNDWRSHPFEVGDPF